MAKKEYDWLNGAELLDHTHRKLKILRDYLRDYLAIRCQLPIQQKFRLAVVDGFAGGGRYKCGTAGSPIVFIEEIENSLNEINVRRASQGLGIIELECLIIFNDYKAEVVEFLESHCTPVLAAAEENSPNLHIKTIYLSKKFEDAYPEIRRLLKNGRYKNILFNLDQCGVSQIQMETLWDIMNISHSVEIFYTFMVRSLLTYLNKKSPEKLASQLNALGISASEQSKLHGGQSNDEWMGAAELIVFENFYRLAKFVSPFSINNPDGWRYWLIHFSSSFRARQAYNMVLHNNATMQAHFGKSGLNMLSYDSREEGQQYLFDLSGRAQSYDQLLEDIPRVISEHGDAILVGEFYEDVYNLTPAHRDDIHSAMLNNPELEIVTEAGGTRQKPNTISTKDTLRLTSQRSFFPLFGMQGSKK